MRSVVSSTYAQLWWSLTRPYGESFISARASSSFSTFMIPATGPKVSSIMTSIAIVSVVARV